MEQLKGWERLGNFFMTRWEKKRLRMNLSPQLKQDAYWLNNFRNSSSKSKKRPVSYY
ncbi:ribonuclease P protein component domain protein [Aerococcus christensenii]|uniref:Ribonuclease P protein component domain protein n=1 Tax=Aerococcus christensenii TaxID=87541 RepID=A0A133Y413_9LACT|nr:ribonuclease P protein component domain protein [Aerococcus christensenii]